MRARHIALLSAAGIVAAGAFAPAVAAPAPKPITKKYEMHLYPGADACGEAVSEGTFRHTETLKLTGPGKLTIKIDDFKGDWDLTLFNSDNAPLALGGGSSTGPDLANLTPAEILVYKIKKPGTYTIRNCNFFGSPDAVGSYKFEPGK